MARLLVTGGSSYLGRHFLPMLSDADSFVYTFYRNDPVGFANGIQLDLRDKTAVSHLITQFQPTTILHLAGSNRPDDMATVIRQGTEHIVSGAKEVSARLIHLSTDSVFDGLDAPYDETAVPTPINEYGRAKADAEASVQSHSNHVIIRTSLIYGLQEMDHGTAWMAQALQENKPVTLFNNQIRNPIWIDTLSMACLELISHNFQGIINIGGNQALTRAAFAIKMFDYWQIKNRKNVTIENSSPNKWPLDCRMDLDLAKKVLKTPLLGVDEVLKR